MANPTRYRRLFRRLSIRQRISFFTCILLSFVVIAYSLTSYIGVKETSVLLGHERVRSISRQLGSMMGESVQDMIKTTHSIADAEVIKKRLKSDNKTLDTAALGELKKLSRDSSTVSVALLGAGRQTLISTGTRNIGAQANTDTMWKIFSAEHDTVTIGKLYAQKDSIYYPVVASVVDQHKIIGYIMRWRVLLNTRQSLAQLTQLIGSDASLFLGNSDGSLWTDMTRPVTAPFAGNLRRETVIEYSNPHKSQVLAAPQQLSNTQWMILVELSKQKMTETANRFLYWDILIGMVLIITGTLAAWLISQSITRPLLELTTVTAAMAEGNHSWLVEVKRDDEVGILARTFNAMAMQVQAVQQDLENKVLERTAELNATNKELEAFSYSVSHDLRAPLRAISGFASMLKDDYSPHLDAEATRIIDIIIINTKMMGQLIDDLISFSIIGRKKASFQEVGMKMLAGVCLSEVLEQYKAISVEVTVADLPACYGDQNLLKQVWMNLISNAVKYSSKQTVPAIEIGFQEDPGANIYFIRDNGVGFDMQYASKIFLVFQRLHTQAEFEGTGIGLALVKRIISKHNGEVWAESTPGKGATFYFSIPKSNQQKIL